jgi:biopolymer transport protein ExbD
MKLVREKVEATIPTASMADIAFLLLIFFMVTTTFRAETGLQVIIPQVEAAEKMPTKDLSHIWISKNGIVSKAVSSSYKDWVFVSSCIINFRICFYSRNETRAL